jgi:tyrosine-protein phosphatase 2/3
VGRTGGFIAVDAVLDGIRREIRKSVKDQVRTAENKAIEDRTDSDGDIMMNETGQRTMPMPPNKGGDVLHVPVIDNGLSPSASIPQRESEGGDTATRRWAENLEHIDSAYSRDVSDPEGRSSFETASLSTASSSEESSSFFPRAGPKNECKENDGEISPNAPSSGYTTSSSFVTTIASEPSGKDGVGSTKSFPSSNSVPVVDFKTLLSARLGEEETSRARTQSAPVAIVSTKEGSPFTSSSLSPSGSDVKDLAAQSTPNLKLSSASTTRPISAVASTSTTNVDYKDPRPMHRPDSPRLLSSCDEPLWEVVQDMREQRMSLCQSLRQYVFVHAAVIEGALMVVDEEKEALGADNVEKLIRQQSGSSHSNAVPAAGPVFVYNDILTASSSSHGKRVASPTELLKEDKMGELRMSKRPSIKRKQRSHDNEMAVYSARESLGERLTLPTFEIG